VFFPVGGEFVVTEKVGAKGNVGLIRLNRPKALNALCDGLMNDLSNAIDKHEADPTIGALVITGNGKAFAAGTENLPLNASM
jgi:enoyl-CoA hydratase